MTWVRVYFWCQERVTWVRVYFWCQERVTWVRVYFWCQERVQALPVLSTRSTFTRNIVSPTRLRLYSKELSAKQREAKEAELQQAVLERTAAVKQCTQLASKLSAPEAKTREDAAAAGAKATAAAIIDARAALALKEAEVEATVMELRTLARSVEQIQTLSESALAAMAVEVTKHRTAAAEAKTAATAAETKASVSCIEVQTARERAGAAERQCLEDTRTISVVESHAAAAQEAASAAQQIAQAAVARVAELELQVELLREQDEHDLAAAAAGINTKPDDGAGDGGASDGPADPPGGMKAPIAKILQLTDDLECSRQSTAAANARLDQAEAFLADVKNSEECAQRERIEAVNQAATSAKAAAADKAELEEAANARNADTWWYALVALSALVAVWMLLYWALFIPSAGVSVVPYLLRIPGPGGTTAAGLTAQLARCDAQLAESSAQLASCNASKASLALTASLCDTHATTLHARIAEHDVEFAALRSEASAHADSLIRCEAANAEAGCANAKTAAAAAEKRARALGEEVARQERQVTSLENKLVESQSNLVGHATEP